MDSHDRTRLALSAANAGADVARERFRSDLEIETKAGKTDVVTQADRDAQTAVVDAIEAEAPGEVIVGEEDDERGTVPEEGPAWIVDPIDGTDNYVRGIGVFATAVAAVIDGEPVGSALVFPALEDVYRSGPAGVVRNGEAITVSDRTDPETCVVCPLIWWDFDRREEYAAANRAIVSRFGDMRRLGCAQAALALVAAGAYDGVITNIEANPWDTVAGVHMIREVGGTVTDLEGDPWRHDSTGLVASNGAIHGEVLEAAREIDAGTTSSVSTSAEDEL